MGETGAGRPRGALPVTLRVLLVLGFGLAVAATALVVFADGARMLRLAVVLALWAALIAAFAVTRSRRDAKAAVTRENEAQLAYQLELHREVAARREYEADLNKQVASAQSDQLAELRGQLERLTGVLSSLADGELTVSRLTLSAESARFRPGAAEQPAVPAGEFPAVTVGDGTVSDPAAALVPGRTVDADEAPAPGSLVGPDAGVRQDEPAPVESPAAAWARRHADWARARDATRGIEAVHIPPEGAAVPEQRAAEAGEGAVRAGERAAEAGEGATRADRAPAAAQDGLPDVQDEPRADRDGPAADGDDEESGEHEAGVSVADLLAAYGLSGRSRRRRG